VTLEKRLKETVVGQEELIENLLRSMAGFLNKSTEQKMNKEVLFLHIHGPTGVGKTFLVQTLLRELDIDSSCVQTSPENSNLTLPVIGMSFFHWDAADMEYNRPESLHINHDGVKFLESVSNFVPYQVSDYVSPLALFFVTSIDEIDAQVSKFRQKLRNLGRGTVTTENMEARKLNKTDIAKCVDKELKLRFPFKTETELSEYRLEVLRNVEFDIDGHSLHGCKVVRNLITLLI